MLDSSKHGRMDRTSNKKSPAVTGEATQQGRPLVVYHKSPSKGNYTMETSIKLALVLLFAYGIFSVAVKMM